MFCREALITVAWTVHFWFLWRRFRDCRFKILNLCPNIVNTIFTYSWLFRIDYYLCPAFDAVYCSAHSLPPCNKFIWCDASCKSEKIVPLELRRVTQCVIALFWGWHPAKKGGGPRTALYTRLSDTVHYICHAPTHRAAPHLAALLQGSRSMCCATSVPWCVVTGWRVRRATSLCYFIYAIHYALLRYAFSFSQFPKYFKKNISTSNTSRI